MAFKVAVTTDRPFDRSVFEKRGIEVVQRNCTTEDEVIETAKDADGVLVWLTPLTSRHVIENLPKCKAISRHGVGVDSVDLEAATEHGVMVCNIPSMNTVEVAEHAVALLLALTRQVVPLNQSIKAGAWTERPQELATRRSKMLRVAGSTVGIIGLGNIGRAFAVRIKGFGPARILAVDPYIEQTTADIYGVQLVDLDTLLRESDFVTVHAPDTSETHHLIGLPELEKMKRNACLVNTARGPLVDNEALCEGLSRGYIAGVALDVTEPEPIGADNPLTRMDNVILTPHYAGYSDVSRRFGFRAWPENVAFVLEGKPPYGLANPDVIGRIAVIRAQGSSKWDNVP